MSVDLEVQKALRARLVASPDVIALVPSQNILDTNQRPRPVPCILMGDSQDIDEGTSLKRKHTRVYHTLHVWKKEASLVGAKAICGKIRQAVKTGRLAMGPGYHCADFMVSSMRYLRDPDGEHSHGVVTVEVLVSEDIA